VEFSSRRVADVTVAAPVGQVDHRSAQDLQLALTPILDESVAGRKPVVLDLSRVDYISSMGLRVLMMAAKQMRAGNARIGVAALQPVVEEIFDIARFKHVLEAFPSVRAALQEFSPAAAAAHDATEP